MFNPAVFQIDKFFGIRWADVKTLGEERSKIVYHVEGFMIFSSLLVVDFRVYPKSFTAAQGSKSKSVPTLGGGFFVVSEDCFGKHKKVWALF